jgi:adhesin/invasin
VNFQVPWGTSVGSASVTVSANGLTSTAVNVPVLTAAPGLFFQASGQAIVQNFPSYALNSQSSPAKVGSTIIAYLTGSGPINPSLADGAVASASPLNVVTSSVSASFGTVPGQVTFAGLTPGFIGLLQMNVVVPSGLNTQDYLLTLTVNGQKSNAATVSVTK